MNGTMTYAVVTPVRDEIRNLERVAECLVRQTVRPAKWVVVNDGSTDGTRELADSLASEHHWIRVKTLPGEKLARGAPIVRAFSAGLAALEALPEVVAKLDADISIEPDHFERLLAEFERDPSLGIAGGTGYERQPDGAWRQRHGTGPAVWGGCRAYRRECLSDVLPLEEHMGWDTLDLMKANLKGWRTEVFYDVAFKHHRVEGERDGHRFRTALIQGEGAHFMGYRLSYLAVRTLYRALRDPAALGLIVGYGRARVRRAPRCADPELRAYVRSHQKLRKLPLRVREALRPRRELAERTP